MASTLEELVVKISADNKDLVASLQASSKATQDASQQMSKSLADLAKEGSENTGALQDGFSVLAGVVGGELIVEAFKKLTEVAEEFFKDTIGEGIKGAIATEDAMQKLNTALALSGEFSQKASKDMEAFADSMQQTTKYGNDTILSASSLIESLGQLDENGLKKATKAAADMAAALGIDLNTAANLVGKAAAGHVETFQRYGLTIAQGSTQAQTFANALEALNQKFGGAAAAQLQTYSGQVELLTHNYDDAIKQVGFAITQNQAVLDVYNELNRILKDYTDGLSDNRDGMKRLVAEGIIILLAALGDVTQFTGAVIDGFKILLAGVETLDVGVSGLADVFNKLFHVNGDSFSKPFKETEDAYNRLSSTVNSKPTFQGLSDDIVKLQAAADKGFAAIGSGADDMQKHVNAAKDPLKSLTAEMVMLGDAGKDLAKQLIDSVTVPDQVYATEKKKLDDDYKNKLKTTEQYFKDLGKLDQNKGKSEQKELDAALKQKKISQDQYDKAIGASDQKLADEERDLAAKKKLQEQKDMQDKLAATATMFGGLGALTATFGQGAFEITKRLNEASAITSGYAAVMNAYANVPYPFNIAAAIGMAAQAAANVASIEAQHFSTGGTVPGVGFSDNVPSMLTPDEEVVDRSTSSKLRSFLDSELSGGKSSRQSGGVVRVEISMKDDVGKFIEAKILQRQKSGTSLLSKAVVA